MRNVFPLICGIVLAALPAFGEEAAEILKSFELHPDFQLEMAAMEPVVLDPVDMEFDEFGRAFVLEMSGYPFPDNNGKIVLITDANGDGAYDTRQVFADGFAAADSILPYKGGLLVASPPQLFFVKDTNGDNVADVKEVLLDGFDLENTQHNFNGLTYAIDNWIYGASGGNSGEVFWPDRPDQKMPLSRNDFRFDLDKKLFELAGRSSGGFGLAMDDWGRIFTTHNTQHIFQIVFPGRYLADLPVGRRGTLQFISDHDEGGLGRIYAIGEQETRVNHPEQSGFFSGACGITFYGGGAFPGAFDDSIFVCDVVLNLVHHDALSPDGPAMNASRTEEKKEFLASTDRAFRPVNMCVGPDGALYVLDMHRTVIEHPEWIPDEMEAKMDINAGKDKGRILRITPKGGIKPSPVAFDRTDIKSVIALFESPNQWRRTTAQRLLVEWKDPACPPLLRAAIRESGKPIVQLHGLWTLQGIGALEAADVTAGLKSEGPGVRENALLLLETLDAAPQETIQAAAALAADSDARVRMQAALTIGVLRDRQLIAADTANAALLAIAGQDIANPWSRWAMLSAARHAPDALLSSILEDQLLRSAPETAEFVQSLAHIMAANGMEGVEEAMAALQRKALPAAYNKAVLNGVADGLSRNAPEASQAVQKVLVSMLSSKDAGTVHAAWRAADRLRLPLTEGQTQMLANATAQAADVSLPKEARLDALNLVAFAPYDDRIDLLFSLLDTRQPKDVQVAAIAQIRQGANEAVAHRLLDVWTTLGPETRSVASDILIGNKSFHPILLTALESGMLPMGQMNFDLERRRALLFWSSDEVKARAEKLFTDAGVVTRKEALEKMRPALSAKGDATKGHRVFQENCMKCHQIANEGFNVGPNLTEIARKSKETLLHDILDPNAAADTQYLAYAILAKDADTLEGGEIVSGLIVDETDAAVTLREAGGIERVFEKSNIAEMRATGLSFMPEELENTLTVESMADLLAFLQLPR
ncbi:MAG: hypothetical protein AMXMBFR84_10230 [Candidatus Hydrogenedentota bacterium]